MAVATKAEQAKAALLDATVAHLRERVQGPLADELERFVRRYYEHVSPADLLERNEADVAGAALAHWGFAAVRRGDEIKVHVYTPNVEQHGWDSPHTVVETVVTVSQPQASGRASFSLTCIDQVRMFTVTVPAAGGTFELGGDLPVRAQITTEDEIDYTIDLIKRKVAKLRELSPLWEMHKEGIDLSTVQWAAH